MLDLNLKSNKSKQDKLNLKVEVPLLGNMKIYLLYHFATRSIQNNQNILLTPWDKYKGAITVSTDHPAGFRAFYNAICMSVQWAQTCWILAASFIHFGLEMMIVFTLTGHKPDD